MAGGRRAGMWTQVIRSIVRYHGVGVLMLHYQVVTTLAADEILQCRCRAGESWPADCSKAAVQRLQSGIRWRHFKW